MTEANAGEMPTEALAEPVPPAPEAVERFSPDLEKTTPEVVSEGEAPVTREAAAPALPEIEHAIGPMRQSVLDHLIDSVDAGPQSVAQILAAMPAGTSRNTTESAIKREFDVGRIERVGPGLYVLAKPKPPGPSKPPPSLEPPPPSPAGHTDEEWIARIEAWQVNPASWNIEEDGPPPNDTNHRIPLDVVGRFKDRLRKREERRRDAEAAAARQAAADAELRDQLLAATGGNFTPGPSLDDVSPIRVAMELVPLDSVLTSIRCKTDRKLYPKNEPATSWGDERLLKAIAEDYCRFFIVPSLVSAWAAAKAPGKRAAAPAAEVDVEVDV
jgi:hypothetical protein